MDIDEDPYEETGDYDAVEIAKYTERLKNWKPSQRWDELREVFKNIPEDVCECIGPSAADYQPGTKNFGSLVKKVATLETKTGEAANGEVFRFVNRTEGMERARLKLLAAHKLIIGAQRLLREEHVNPGQPLPPDTPIGCEHDDPDLDCTDFAHPAWWRGQDHAAEVFCRKVNEVLDGKDSGSGSGYEPWESTRRRLLALVTKS